ncbi:hypothetical protein [Mycolicibacterium sp. F2034L]|uniref:hypothetical protein n=1 Tax=Mycolicibacterium sp. F2034L TaxID=2926422 RepID=UPI001FF19933|nr:hypothetical protein [Mycolicibacterium sp. F2034L]MCK0174799.1 hypothetical protein [Mycolicibacterium sp. F2034L]
MALKRYDVVDPHTGRETTLQLSDEDAKKMGLISPQSEPKAKTTAAKAKTPANKQATAPANKSAGASKD